VRFPEISAKTIPTQPRGEHAHLAEDLCEVASAAVAL